MRRLKAAAGPIVCFLAVIALQYEGMASNLAKVQMDLRLPAKGTLAQGTLVRFETRTLEHGGRNRTHFEVDVPVVQFTTVQGQQIEHVATEYGYSMNTKAKSDLRIGQTVPIYYLLSPSLFARVEQWHSKRDDYVYLSIDIIWVALFAWITVVMTRRALREAE